MQGNAGKRGSTNVAWRGGRTATKAGYILVKDHDHPAADVRGYVYEHRLVMESVLGRLLSPGERVRHADLDPSNNAPENLVLVKPLDRAETTTCVCGCGTQMARLDSAGRSRKFVSGHNSRKRSVRPGRRPRIETGRGIDTVYRVALTEAFGGVCAYGCGRPSTCWDHVVSFSQGGSFLHGGNAVPACAPCNSAKSDDAEVWSWIDRGLDAGLFHAWESIIITAISEGCLELEEVA